ncbi:MAG: Sua5 YciO YrdC YwlC family protein [Campylobacteraceae bacterium]|nr:Sua5 YciO YrdC YwlC family protein [Campylobacteraceae bacterium]
MNKESIYLTQTDTTVGFLSSDDKKLNSIKQRSTSQKMLQIVDSYKTLKQQLRIPKHFRKLIRKSKKTTFIYPNGNSYRFVDRQSNHYSFIKKFGILFSTSANITKTNFDQSYAENNCDVIVEDKNGFYETTASKIFKINKTNIIKLR